MSTSTFHGLPPLLIQRHLFKSFVSHNLLSLPPSSTNAIRNTFALLSFMDFFKSHKGDRFTSDSEAYAPPPGPPPLHEPTYQAPPGPPPSRQVHHSSAHGPPAGGSEYAPPPGPPPGWQKTPSETTPAPPEPDDEPPPYQYVNFEFNFLFQANVQCSGLFTRASPLTLYSKATRFWGLFRPPQVSNADCEALIQ